MKRILVIEDNPDNLLLVKMLLSPLKVHLHTATDGPTGIAAARKESFDLILLDIQLPGMDGYQVAQTLRADPRTAELPIIAFTGLDTSGDYDAAYKAGCNAFISKPLNPALLIEVVERLVPKLAS